MSSQNCLVLDAMGVVYQAADDVAELLIPFVREQLGQVDENRVQAYYHQASLGQLSPDEFWKKLKLDPSVEDEYLQHHALNAGLFEVLAHARELEWKIWCLSNDVGRWSQKLRERFRLADYFDGFVISGDVNMRKPSPEIYRKFIKTARITTGNTFFVDDKPNNLLAAAECGLQPVLFDQGNPGGGLDCPVIQQLHDLIEIMDGQS